MLAGELAAGATALEGWLAQIDLDLIRLGAAALAFAPDERAGFVAAERHPLARVGQILPGLRAGRIRCELENPIPGPAGQHEHLSNKGFVGNQSEIPVGAGKMRRRRRESMVSKLSTPLSASDVGSGTADRKWFA